MEVLGSALNTTAIVSAACVGAAVCAGVYVLWGPDQIFRKKGQCPGLVNLGNTCFMNAVLQSLATLPGLKHWLTKAHNGRLCLALEKVLDVLSENTPGIHSPAAVLKALRCHHWRIDFQQQDAYELYHVLLTTLDEEMITCPSLLADLHPLLEDVTSCPRQSRTWSRTGCVTAPDKPPACPLQGLLCSELLCCHCKYSLPMKYESFDGISLSVHTGSSQCTLQTSLLEFIKSEVVYDVECPQCSKVADSKVKRTFLKQLRLGRAPDCLCIHFNRSLWQPDGSVHKNHAHVSFPIDLNASQLLKRQTSQSRLRYKLSAVVEHTGGPFSGHYGTYRRAGGVAHNKQWVYVSDTTVYATTVSEVLKAEAYMLFYYKTQTSNSLGEKSKSNSAPSNQF